MTALVIVVLVQLFLIQAAMYLLRWVREDQAARIAEHWRRNGRSAARDDP